MRAKYTGPKGLVEVGSRKLKPGDIVGEPGSGAPVEGCIGVVAYLLKRSDFTTVGDDNYPIEEATGPYNILNPPVTVPGPDDDTEE